MTAATRMRMAAAGVGGEFFPYFWEILPVADPGGTGGPLWQVEGVSSAFVAGYGYSDPGVVGGDDYEWFLPMAAGTWTVTVIWRGDSDRGIFTVALGGSTLATGWDQYAASAASNQVTSWTGITVANDGIYELNFLNTGKNVSSTDYRLSLQTISAWRTGA